MTDRDLIEKRLAFIETCVYQLRELAHPEQIEHDIREERFTAHTLQIAIQPPLVEGVFHDTVGLGQSCSVEPAIQ